MLKSERKKKSFDLHISGQENIPEKGGVLVVADHGGTDSIACMVEALGPKQTYVVLSEDLKKSGLKNRVAAELAGPIWINRFKKKSIARARKKAVRLLKEGYRVLMYPTAAEELAPSTPVAGVKAGFYNWGKEASVPVLPAATEIDDSRGDIRFGKVIDVNQFTDFQAAEDGLTDTIATLRWALWEELQAEQEQALGRKLTKEEAWAHYEKLMRSEQYTGFAWFRTEYKGDIAALKKRKDKPLPSKEIFPDGGHLGYADADEVFASNRRYPNPDRIWDGLSHEPNPYSQTNIYEHFLFGDDPVKNPQLQVL